MQKFRADRTQHFGELSGKILILTINNLRYRNLQCLTENCDFLPFLSAYTFNPQRH